MLSSVLHITHELGYSRATVDRVAAATGVAKTTIYRRWPSKGELVVASLREVLQPLPSATEAPERNLRDLVRWGVARLAQPGVAAAFAGVFAEAAGDAELREVLRSQLQEPYLHDLEKALDAPTDRVLLIVDIVIGTLLHRAGITGQPMADEDVGLLITITQQLLAR